MAGTRIGGIKSRDKNLASDPDYYKRIGQIGGKWNNPAKRYFAVNRDAARIAGTRGGEISRRPKKI